MNCQSITGATLPWYDCTINGMPISFIISFAMVGLLFLYGMYCLVWNVRDLIHRIRVKWARFKLWLRGGYK